MRPDGLCSRLLETDRMAETFAGRADKMISRTVAYRPNDAPVERMQSVGLNAL